MFWFRFDSLLRYRNVCAFVSISVRIRIHPPRSGSINQRYGSGSGSESFYETVAEEWVYNTLTASTTLSQPWESTCEFPITSQLSACRLQRPWECFRGYESVSRGRRSTLSWPQLTFSGTSSSLSRPLKHLKASIDTLTASYWHSHGLNWHSQGPLQASHVL